MGPGYKIISSQVPTVTQICHLYTLDTLSLESSACDILSFSGTRYIRREFKPSALGLEGLQWDSADLYMVR